jgi:hypothetical protein
MWASNQAAGPWVSAESLAGSPPVPAHLRARQLDCVFYAEHLLSAPIATVSATWSCPCGMLPEVERSWTRTDQRVATASAWALFGVGLLYILTTTAGFVAAGGLQAPIVDPVFAMMELLILVEAPLIVVLFAALHRYAAPSRRSFSLAALALVVVMTTLTLGVHFVLLTVGRQVDPSLIPAFDRFFSCTWPSVVYALDILAWDVCFGLALLFAAAVFVGRGIQRVVRIGLVVAGVLCLAGLLGVVTANMQIRNIGIVGYAIVFPVVILFIARVFGREYETARDC